jgi:hypothetical protein
MNGPGVTYNRVPTPKGYPVNLQLRGNTEEGA